LLAEEEAEEAVKVVLQVPCALEPEVVEEVNVIVYCFLLKILQILYLLL
jgi:hypothetical protein